MSKSWKQWEELPDGFRRRAYQSDEEYREKQAQKLTSKLGWCRSVDQDCYDKLLAVLHRYPITAPGMSVLCLGARLGGEVRAFREMGCFAVGIDLNPGENNTLVLYGDFHHIQFANSSLDIVFTNSLDHVLYLANLLAEVKRILKPGGIFFIESKVGYANRPGGRMSDHWDCFEWETIKKLQAAIEAGGFQLTMHYLERKQRAHPHGLLFGANNEGL
jgi:SAM-dependent methyltransferase